MIADNLAQVGMTKAQLSSMLREASVFKLADVELAMLEPSGRLSAKKKTSGAEKTSEPERD